MSKTDIINIDNYNENNQQFINLNTEDIFIRQKSEIEKIKLKNKSIKLKTTFDLSNQGDITNNSHRLNNNPTQINNKNENLNNSLQPISLLDYNNFECTDFDYNMDTERETLPKIDNIWIENSQIKAYKNGQKHQRYEQKMKSGIKSKKCHTAYLVQEQFHNSYKRTGKP